MQVKTAAAAAAVVVLLGVLRSILGSGMRCLHYMRSLRLLHHLLHLSVSRGNHSKTCWTWQVTAV
jgi:hypothetical protein